MRNSEDEFIVVLAIFVREKKNVINIINGALLRMRVTKKLFVVVMVSVAEMLSYVSITLEEGSEVET